MLFAAQVHLCEPSFRLPNGQTCLTCPTLSDIPAKAESGLTAQHGDCHDCCVEVTCSEHDHGSAAIGSGWVAFEVVALLPTQIDISTDAVDDFRPCFVHVASAPNNGPPNSTRSRAPPCFAESLTSAGRSFAIG